MESAAIGHDSDDWTDAIDRGGLKHVSDVIYQDHKTGVMEEVIAAIKVNEDVTFYCSQWWVQTGKKRKLQHC